MIKRNYRKVYQWAQRVSPELDQRQHARKATSEQQRKCSLLVDPELDQRQHAAEAERKATSEQQRILRKRQLKAAKWMSRQQARGPRYGLSQRGRESCRH
jgi:hypothetical protein